MELDPETLSARDRYKLLIGLIAPRPIALVSTISTEGRLNLAPFSFFNGVGSNPMTIVFCPANRSQDGGEKDTLRNCKAPEEGGTGEFVVNAAVEEYQPKVAAAAEALPWGESEFELVGLTPAPGRAVKPPRVAESPWAFECRTMSVVRTNPGARGGGNLVIGRVVHVHVADAVVDGGLRADYSALHPIGRMGGLGYCTTRNQFEMPMGREALRGR